LEGEIDMIEVNIDYSDGDQHLLSFSTDNLYNSVTLTKKEFNNLIKQLIEYSQGHKDWEEK
jgi:hypothetical protein